MPEQRVTKILHFAPCILNLNIDMFEQFKSIMQNGERYIVVEGGKPEYVVMNFADYVALAASGKKGNPGHDRGSGQVFSSPDVSRANAELEEIRAGEREFKTALADAAMTTAPDPTAIRLEDLPL